MNIFRKIIAFFDYTKLSVYILLGEMVVLGGVSLWVLQVAEQNETAGKIALKAIIYGPMQPLTAGQQKLLIKECSGFECLYPTPNAWGVGYDLIVWGVALYILSCILAGIVRYIRKMLAKEPQIG